MADFLINVVVDTGPATQGVRNVDRSLASIEQSIRRVGQALTVVFAFQQFTQLIRGFSQFTDELLNAENRVRSLGIEGRQLDGVIQDLFGVANRTRQEFSITAEVFTRTAASLRVLGLGTEEAIALTESLNQAVALSGSTTAEASNALIQFSQGLASGTLRGDELRSVLEQIPVVADVIAARLGVTRNELRGLAEDGTITPQVIVQAFREAREELAERFAALIPTISQSFVVLRNRVVEVGGGFLQTSGVAEGLALAILGLANNIEVVLRSVGALVVALTVALAGRAIPLVIAGFRALFALFATNPFGLLVTGAAVAIRALVASVTLAIGALTAFSDQIEFTNDGVATLADVAVVAFQQLRDAFVTGLNVIIGLINEFIPSFDAIDISLQDLATRAAQILDVVVAVFAAAFVAIGETAQNFGPVVQDAFFQGLNNVIAIVEDGINSIIAGIGELGPALFDTARNAVIGFASIFDIGFSDIIDFVSTLPERIGNAFTGLFSAGEEAGQSLIEGIDNAIDVEVDPLAGSIEVSLARLENPASGALGQVGEAAVDEFTRVLGQAPASETLEGVLEGARARATARAADVGADVGQTTAENLTDAVIAEQANLAQALEGLVDTFTDFLGLSEQQFENFVANVETILGGLNLGQVFDNAIASIATLIGVTESELVNAFGGVFAILNELGIEIDSVLGEDAIQVIRLLGAVTSEQFQGILSTIGALPGAFSSVVTGAQAAFTAITSGASAASVALAPIALVIAAIAAAILLVAGNAGLLGEEFQEVSLILSAVFAPFLLSFEAARFAIEFLIDLFNELGDIGGTTAQVLGVVFAPVIVPIRLIIEAVEFLIDLFGGLGDAGSTVAQVLAVVLAPIVLPILAIIEVVQFLIDLFGNLGDSVGIFGDIFGAVFGVIQGIAEGVFGAILAAGQVLFDALGALLGIFQGDFGGVFNAILGIASSTWGAIQGITAGAINAIQGLLGGLQNFAAGVWNAIQGAAGAAWGAIQGIVGGAIGAIQGLLGGLQNFAAGVWNAIQGAAGAAWGAIQGIAGGAINTISGLLSGLGNLGASVFNGLLGAAQGAFNGIISAAQNAANVVGGIFGDLFGGIGGGIGGAFGGIGGIIGGGFGGIKKGAKKIGKIFGFAEGGVINGPVSLSGDGVAGKAFRSGGVLPSSTLIGGVQNITSTRQLGLAGEAGPEAILPLTRTSNGLGVSSIIPPDVIRLLSNRAGNDNGGGTTIVQRVVLISTSSETVEELREEVLDLGASLEQRVDVRLSDVLSEVGRVA